MNVFEISVMQKTYFGVRYNVTRYTGPDAIRKALYSEREWRGEEGVKITFLDVEGNRATLELPWDKFVAQASRWVAVS